MKEILNFFNNNAVVASLMTLVISTFIQVIFRKSDRKYNERQACNKERRKQYQNKAEFIIDNNIEDDSSIPHINLLITDFRVKLINKKQDVEFYYPKDILDVNKYKHLKFYLKNIGHTAVNQLDICVISQKHNMLCNIDNIGFFVKNKLINYNFFYDKKIFKGNKICIDIAYLSESKIFRCFNSELALLFKDSYGNLYEQPFFLQQKNLSDPIPISLKDYRIYTQTDTAIECFKNPWMW